MPSLDNANPIIFKPSQQSIRVSELKTQTLWHGLFEDGSVNHLTDIDLNHAEPVDEQEVFGKQPFRCL